MFKKIFSISAILIGFLAFSSVGSIAAEGELAVGTVISAANFDAVKDKIFEGKRVGDMIPEKLELMIRKHGLTMKIRHSAPIEMDPKYMKATQEGKGHVTFDPATREAHGWKAGMFFDPQDIHVGDPNAGDKLIWNLRGPTYGSTMDLRNISFVFIDGKKGVQRIQRWWSRRYYMEGRLDGGPLSEGKGDIMQKTILVATSPADIKGLGTFSIRYNDPSAKRPDDPLRCDFRAGLLRHPQYFAVQRYSPCRLGVYRIDVFHVPRLHAGTGGFIPVKNTGLDRDCRHSNGFNRRGYSQHNARQRT